MPSKPSCSASTACARRSSGGKCSWEAWKKYRVVAMPSDYPRSAWPKRRFGAVLACGAKSHPCDQSESLMSDYAVVNPATGETVKEYPTISDDDLRAAIGRADAAHREWSASTTAEERAALVRRVGELHAEQRARLAEIIVREMGKPIEQALAELDFCAAIYEYYADNAPRMLADEPIELLDGEGSAFIRRSPYGVLLGIMPWNFPYYQVARFAGPNLVVGNTILLKHAPQCPESAEAMQAIYDEAGFPPGAFNNIRASNEQIEWVIGDPRVRGVSLTGSERAGAAVAAAGRAAPAGPGCRAARTVGTGGCVRWGRTSTC